MNYLDKIEKNISICTEEDYCDIARFFQDHRQFWTDNTVLNYSRWKWMFIANPNTTYPCIWMFKKDNKILAHQASIPFLLKVGNEYHRAAWGVKLIVAPEHQNKGIGALLTRKWTADIDVPVALGVRNGSYKMYTRAGWADLGKMPCFVKPLNAGYIIQKRISTLIVAQTITRITNFCLKLRDAIRFFKVSGTHVYAQKVERFDQKIDELWERVSIQYDIIARRDSMYLNWKYADDPDISYTLFQFSCGEDMIVGYAILIIGEENNIRTGHIVDFLIESRYIKIVMEWIIRYFRNQRAQKVYLRILCKRLETLLRKIGFYQRGEWVKILVKQNDNIPSTLRDPDRWFITPGDSDLTDGEMNDTFRMAVNRVNY